MSRRTVHGCVVVLTAAVVSAVAACGPRPEDTARGIDAEQVPFGLLEGTTTTLAPLGGAEVGCDAGAETAVSLSDDDLVADIDVSEGIAVVELVDGILGSLGAEEQLRVVAQLTCALTVDTGVTGVRFRQDGRSLEVPREDGSLTSDAVDRSDYASLLQP